ncbi:hypothetical protein K1S17_13090, partial [Klebsiella pneumoniae]|nr:hypothetical protein [Klebsiella pneumoniae]MCA5144512.1 hypothetical protein [Klebsiella pneumoniae]MCA5190827.1 hypothetical protein [Klebsiella pneumoniae]MCA5206292.1 hypothetical protein [Klebsiella pneumoniae]MCA5216582.1 hypothetical protein [Klebsiella pneumoniae]
MSQKRKLLPAALGLLSLASLSVAAADALSLQGKTIGVAVVGTQHFWDREAFKGATEEVEKLGGKVIGVDGGRDNQVHANNHDILLSRKVDAVIREGANKRGNSSRLTQSFHFFMFEPIFSPVNAL